MSLNVSQIRAIFFDVDGTLSDTDDVMVAQLSQPLRSLNFLFPKRDVTQVARRIVMAAETPVNFLIGIPDILGMDDELVAFADWMARKSHNKPKKFLMIPGVKEMLEVLSKRFPMAVVSARDERTTLIFLEQFGLTQYFKCIATAQTCEHTKPFPDPLLWAAKEMGVDPEDCLMVGDTTVDIRAGKAAGAKTIGVLCGFGDVNELQRRRADMILATTTELVHVLEAGE